MSTRRVVGCMTGSSLDGLDVALVTIEGRGLAMRARFVRGRSTPLGSVGPLLRRLAEQRAMTAREVCAVQRDFAMLHARAIEALLDGESCDLVCVHGQTVFHEPPLSWQVMQPAPIAHALGVPVVYDLRQADLAAGGQGAPITPLADWVLFRDATSPVSVINLGGFCNITNLPAGGDEAIDRIEAMDVCACNQLLDAIARARLGCGYDADGATAMNGAIVPRVYDDAKRLLVRQAESGRSLGTGDELAAWMDAHADVASEDLLRSACEAIAEVIVRRGVALDSRRVLLAGGGTMNRALIAAIRERAQGRTASTTDEAGVPAAYREAACFAVLGSLCQDGVPITLPHVTRCTNPAPVSGVWVYPSRERPA